jgi:hypothetical protein
LKSRSAYTGNLIPNVKLLPDGTSYPRATDAD